MTAFVTIATATETEGTGLSARGLHFLDRIDNDIRGVPTDALVAYRSVADTLAIPIG